MRFGYWAEVSVGFFFIFLLSVFNIFLWLPRRGKMVRSLIGARRYSVLGFPENLFLEEWYFR